MSSKKVQVGIQVTEYSKDSNQSVHLHRLSFLPEKCLSEESSDFRTTTMVDTGGSETTVDSGKTY